jgi:glycosyltransferase involved in cell wall biosynthesis
VRIAFTVEQCWHEVPGGTAVATLRLARELLTQGDIELAFVAGRHRTPPAPEWMPPGPVQMLPIARPWLYETWLRWGWPRVESVASDADVVHSTAGIPAGTRLPHVVTLHDVAFLRRPDRLTRHGARVLTRAVDRARSASMVACPSNTVRDDLIGHGFDADRVAVVPWGVDPIDVDDDDRHRVRQRFDLPERFVLAVATLEPRKNLRRLIEAMAARDEPLPLVVAGAAGWGGVVAELSSATKRCDVRFLGHVERADLLPLLALAEVLAYPSEEEGFGLPVLEAMAVGTAVVTSAGTATQDVAGGAAVLVDPFEVASIAAGIDEAVRLRTQLEAAGRRRAEEFTWSATAAAMIEVYRRAAR